MKMRSGPKVSGRSRRMAADQGWSLRGVRLYQVWISFLILNGFLISRGGGGGGCKSVVSAFFAITENLLH